jgi:hypothetical protein
VGENLPSISINKSKLSEYDITETVYNTGIKSFTSSDLNEWIGKEPISFLEKYVDDRENKIERDDNVLELYYNAVDFQGNFREKSEDIIIGDNGEKNARIEISAVPLYDKKTDKEVGIAHWKCIDNRAGVTKYIECKLIYFLNNDFIPESVRKANSSILPENSSSTIVTEFNYTSRPGLGTLFAEGDFFISKGYYSFENGLNRCQAINNIYLPTNSSEKRRSILVYFNKIDSNNFLPQENYGVESIGVVRELRNAN